MTNKNFQNSAAIILAGGMSTRMNSDVPNFMHKIGKMPVICHVINNILPIFQNIVVVLNDSAHLRYLQDIRFYLDFGKDNIEFVFQKCKESQLDSIKFGLSHVGQNIANILIINANMPFVSSAIILQMLQVLNNGKETEVLPAAILLSYKLNIQNYNESMFYSEDHELVHSPDTEKDSNLQSLLFSSGIVVLHLGILKSFIYKVDSLQDSPQLLEIVREINSMGLSSFYLEAKLEDILRINTVKNLALAEHYFQQQMRAKFIENGVFLIAPETVFFTATTTLKSKVVIHPFVTFGVNVVVESGAEIKSFSHIENAYLAEDIKIGPFVTINEKTVISKNVSVGSFTEIKDAFVGEHTNVGCLAFLNNSDVGKNNFIGSGMITCDKINNAHNRNKIKDYCFIDAGSIIARGGQIGSDSDVMLGSKIYNNVPDNSLSESFVVQKIKKKSPKASCYYSKIKNNDKK